MQEYFHLFDYLWRDYIDLVPAPDAGRPVKIWSRVAWEMDVHDTLVPVAVSASFRLFVVLSENRLSRSWIPSTGATEDEGLFILIDVGPECTAALGGFGRAQSGTPCTGA